MVKNMLAGVAGLSLFCLSFTGKAGNGFTGLRSSYNDTADKKDSMVSDVRMKDAKQEFAEFDIAKASLPLGINAEQLNPEAVLFVQDYVQKHGRQMSEIREWGRPYFAMMDGILADYSLPLELKYLAVIESYLKTNARSWAGAVGPWQFMPQTARNMGLKVNGKYDERRDFAKSTVAASKYLTGLYELYGDWLLVIAAYNGGPGKVDAAIRKSGSRDFWTLQRYLPLESRNHVKKFIATHYMMEGQGGPTTLTKDESLAILQPASATTDPDAKSQSINGRYNSAVILKYIAMDAVAFNKLNPNFDKQIAMNGNYELRLPGEKMNAFLANKPAILNESMELLLSSTR